MGLVVVEQAPGGVGVVAALAADQRVGDPAEQAVAELLAQEELAAVAAADDFRDERGGERRRGQLAARRELVDVLVEPEELGAERAGDAVGGAGGGVVGADRTEGGVAEHGGQVGRIGRLVVDAAAGAELEVFRPLVILMAAQIGGDMPNPGPADSMRKLINNEPLGAAPDAANPTHQVTEATDAVQRSALTWSPGGWPNTVTSPSRGGRLTEPSRDTALRTPAPSMPSDSVTRGSSLRR